MEGVLRSFISRSVWVLLPGARCSTEARRSMRALCRERDGLCAVLPYNGAIGKSPGAVNIAIFFAAAASFIPESTLFKNF